MATEMGGVIGAGGTCCCTRGGGVGVRGGGCEAC